MFECKLCGKSFPSLRSFHIHVARSEKYALPDYYEKFYPRNDLVTGQKIPYSPRKHNEYFEKLFISKKTEFSYIMENLENEKGRAILLKQFIESSGKAGRFPKYLEWRSSKFLKYDTLGEKGMGILNEFAETYNVKKIYDYFAPVPKLNLEEYDILVDTREQKPLLDSPKTTINVGDYTLCKEHYNSIHVDRKSCDDFIGTFSSGLERFERECEKAAAMNIELVVLVEASFSKVINYMPPSYKKSQRVQGIHSFHGARQISRKFKNVQFLFVDGREEAVKYLRIILNNESLVLNHDLQYLYETKKI